jgi:hypothetical protein
MPLAGAMQTGAMQTGVVAQAARESRSVAHLGLGHAVQHIAHRVEFAQLGTHRPV